MKPVCLDSRQIKLDVYTGTRLSSILVKMQTVLLEVNIFVFLGNRATVVMEKCNQTLKIGHGIAFNFRHVCGLMSVTLLAENRQAQTGRSFISCRGNNQYKLAFVKKWQPFTTNFSKNLPIFVIIKLAVEVELFMHLFGN